MIYGDENSSTAKTLATIIFIGANVIMFITYTTIAVALVGKFHSKMRGGAKSAAVSTTVEA